jgi:hypothetical protein
MVAIVVAQSGGTDRASVCRFDGPYADTPAAHSPGNRDTHDSAADLVVRLGRLAFGNPRWTPAAQHSTAPRRSRRRC